MRSPGVHAALATFTAIQPPTDGVMERGIPFSSVARFPARDDLEPVSLLLQSQGGNASDFVRAELLANPSDTAKLSGVEFELLGGDTPLGRGKILKVATELDRKERIVFFAIRHPGKTDREITDAVDGKSKNQQAVNRACRELESIGKLQRKTREDGLIGNYPVSALYVSADAERRGAGESSGAGSTREDWDGLEEDELKAHLERWLKASGWRTQVAWGRERGVDVEAVSRDGERWLIEVKGCGSRSAMRVNYFIAVLGETLQRMDDANARYSVALPDMPQFRGLWNRLPRLAKDRTRISMLFVDGVGRVRESH